jgi:DNA invertase Pin-like site-specific DNA recombinase
MNKRKSNEAKRNQCDAMLAQFMPVKTIAMVLRMSRGTVSERAKRTGMTRHYITDEEVTHLHGRRSGLISREWMNAK